MQWTRAENIQSRQFVCGYCGDKVAPKEGYRTSDAPGGMHAYLYVCPGCTEPTFIHHTDQSPGVVPGNEVAHLPVDIEAYTKKLGGRPGREPTQLPSLPAASSS